MSDLFQFLCRMGDNTLVLGHRLSEWCGVAPVLEEDIALANTALDLIGQTQMWLALAAKTEGNGRSADDLTMLRDVGDFHNVLLVERPNEDFGHMMMLQFLFDSWHVVALERLQTSSNTEITAIADKAIKEAQYHVMRSSETVIALGDGTQESHDKMQAALDALWPYAGEMFLDDAIDEAMMKDGIAPLPSTVRAEFYARIEDVFAQATLIQPVSSFAHRGGKDGFRHTEYLGHMLTQMQWMQRAYPGMNW